MVQIGEVCCVYWARIIATSRDQQKSRCFFFHVCVNELILWLWIDLLFYSISLLNGVNHDTVHYFCVKVCLSKTKHHMATPHSRHTRVSSCASYQSNKQQSANKLRTLFSFYPADFLSLILHRLVQLRWEGLESSVCRHVSVCLSGSLQCARSPCSLTAALSPKPYFPPN